MTTLIEAVSDADAEADVAVVAYLMGTGKDDDEVAVTKRANDVWAARFLTALQESGYVVARAEDVRLSLDEMHKDADAAMKRLSAMLKAAQGEGT